MDDLINRQAAIDIERNATVNTNPMHFEAHQKFTQFMDDAEISSFGRWQWSNGFNTALTAVSIDLKKLPSAQPERIIFANMSDEEFEKWLYEHGICNPNIHESIPCDAVPLLIDNAISELPSAQSERRKGQWIEHNTGHSTYFDCSCCGCCAPCTETADVFVWKLSNYCPDCGAKMWDVENYESNRWRCVDKREAVRNQPCAQPEIICCKDCRHYKDEIHYCDYFEWHFNGDDFCSKAERIQDGTD